MKSSVQFLSFKTSQKKLGEEGFEIYVTNVKIENILGLIAAIQNVVCDMTWIGKMSPTVQKCFDASASETVKKIYDILVQKIHSLNSDFEQKEDSNDEGKSLKEDEKIRKDFGQYAVSYCAVFALGNEFRHEQLPLSEIFKESESGNPGFDFHTLKDKSLLVFGESKYNKSGEGKSKSLSQIVRFLDKRKQMRDIVELMHMTPAEAILNLNSNKFYVAAAFTTNKKETDITAEKLIISENIIKIKKAKVLGLYIIAINEGDTF